MEIFLRCDLTGRLLWIPWDAKGNKSFLFMQPYVQKDLPLLFCEYTLKIEQDFLDILYYFCSTEIFFVSRVKLFGNCYIRQLFQAIVLHVPDIVSNFRHRPSRWGTEAHFMGNSLQFALYYRKSICSWIDNT